MASRVDLVGIKTQIMTIMNTANTTTASPIDLSSGMARRVQKVLKVNPAFLPLQASFYPLVTCYIKSKDIDGDDIAKDQLSAKRKATVSIQVVGAVWNQNFQTVTEDPADEDINYLMENIEMILRNDYNLGSKVSWQRPTNLEFYSTAISEQTHLRAGFLSLDARIFY